MAGGHLREKDKYKGTVPLSDEMMAVISEPETDFLNRLLFWDVLQNTDNETALYLVLRHCLGYSVAEISAGLNVGYNRVRHLTLKARRSATPTRD